MKKSWWRRKISFKCKCLVVPLLFVVSAVVFVSYFAASYVMAAERKCKIKPSHVADIQTISLEALKHEIDSNDDLVVINVLNEKYYKEAHIPESINMPFKDAKKFKKSIKKRGYHINAPIVVYCYSLECPLSRQAYEALTELGYTNVRAYEGGIKEWKDAGNEIAQGDIQ